MLSRWRHAQVVLIEKEILKYRKYVDKIIPHRPWKYYEFFSTSTHAWLHIVFYANFDFFTFSAVTYEWVSMKKRMENHWKLLSFSLGIIYLSILKNLHKMSTRFVILTTNFSIFFSRSKQKKIKILKNFQCLLDGPEFFGPFPHLQWIF